LTKKAKVQDLINHARTYIPDFREEEKEAFLKEYKKNFQDSHHWRYPFQNHPIVDSLILELSKQWFNHHKSQPLSTITLEKNQYEKPTFVFAIEESIKASLNHIGEIIIDKNLPDKIKEVK